MSATVSSSFIAMRPKVSRISFAALIGVGVAVGTFGVDVDETHLHRGQRILEVARVDVAIGIVVGHEHAAIFDDAFGAVRVANVAAEPGGFGAPIDVVIRFPNILATAAEAEGFETHRFEGDVAREDHQVGPRNLAAILLLDRPEEPAGFVEADVVWPTVEWGEALLTAATAAAAVARAVSAGGVPCHANEQGAVVTEVGRPPRLRVGHQGREVFLHVPQSRGS